MPPSDGEWKVFRNNWWGDEEVEPIPCADQSAAEAIWYWKNAEEPGRWEISCEWWEEGSRCTMMYRKMQGGETWEKVGWKEIESPG
jgi:hypothetical protein